MENIKNSKLLVIGENSLIGSNLINKAKDDFEIITTYFDKKISKNSTKIDLITETKKLQSLIVDLKPFTVIHTVAYPNVDFCEKNQKDAYNLHVSITEDIAKTCASIGSKLVYFSTDAVFDGYTKGKYCETDSTNSLSYYGKTKLEAEKVIMTESPQNLIFRTTVIYGSDNRSRFTNWVLNNLRENKPVTAFTDQTNTPTLVDDLCLSLIKSLKVDLSGIFHAVGKSCLTRYDFAKKLANKFSFDENLVIPTLSSTSDQIAPRPENGCLDANKLEHKINFEFCNIDEGIDFIFHNQDS